MSPESWFYVASSLLAILAVSLLRSAKAWRVESSKYPRRWGEHFKRVTLPVSAASTGVLSMAMLCLGLFGTTDATPWRTAGVVLLFVGGGIAAFGVRRFAR